MITLRSLLVAALVLAVPSLSGAQTRSTLIDKSRPSTYGIVDETTHVVGAWQFQPINPADVLNGRVGEAERFFTVGGTAQAHAQLPSGALITAIELQACDTSATGTVTARLFSTEVFGSVITVNHGSVQTGAAFNGGCGYYFDTLPTPVEVDNFFRAYIVQVQATAASSANTFIAVRLYYKLQVSPAPGTATFADVPVGSPFHRFVEALVAAGITGGCGGGNYCPNQAVTRGQMAVFLSAALGLHFPN